ncbi:rod shape-determining protein RodA [Enterobacteriaceae endosymbiont of Neohaemonia nigricornis]|uniref:rod shape-determining protein RodA n=1 Tax=Enterobacteriaceae endosymbiont of Neohaemonia nigricornis TaxID=2675792 RepID=UPI0014490E18|nr:rod shape-determining protein RodA [Enterobacteriaceae endosymbiont of Neohaemonia nigricornis]QJC30483.1 rod shape-determining protein RodA [Enterobacteriaceae endosymbiont of Neohaemonia nigricornis]
MRKNNIYIFIQKKLHLDLIFLYLILLLLLFSIMIVWSASNKNLHILNNKIIQIFIGLVIMLIIAQIPPRLYINCFFLFYIICIFLLILVNILGNTIKGAQRWLDIGLFKFQPSEIIKVILPLFLAQYFNNKSYTINIKQFFISILIIIIPTILVIKQPDLGTAILIDIAAITILFLSGLSWRLIIINILFILISLPILWFIIMHDYQRSRILILLHPENDSLKTGYHILQSKIAIGSGGLFGKGWLNGTQTQLQFLPEKYTDFIFSVIAEEFGFVGVIILITVYILLIIRGIILALRLKNIFKQVIICGIMIILFFYIFINISMVSGILPIVGVPLPLISYGGSSLIMMMSNFGIIMSLYTHDNYIKQKYF